MKSYSDKEFILVQMSFDDIKEQIRIAEKHLKAFKRGSQSSGTKLRNALIRVRALNLNTRKEITTLKENYERDEI